MMSREAPAGRLVLMVGAYAPVFLIAGLRGWPNPVAQIACGVAVVGTVAWVLVVSKLKTAQPRSVTVQDACAIDGEVTAYIVSLLLPAVAASAPSGQDWGAYAVCALLILIVAWGAKLWSVNPLVYVLGLRVIRVQINGDSFVALANYVPAAGEPVVASRSVGVVLIRSRAEGGA